MVAHKSDINSQVERFIAKLKRREVVGPSNVAISTATLLKRFISAIRWSSPEDLISQIQDLGRRLVEAQPREFSCGNIVRRVLFIVRETVEDASGASEHPVSSMIDLLQADDEETYSKEEKKLLSEKDLRAELLIAIQELIEEIANTDEAVASQSLDLVYENEILLVPTPSSSTVLEFLLKVKQKRNFTVVVTESYPNELDVAHAFAAKLAKAGIKTVVIPDTTTNVIMCRVGKVICGVGTILANGGMVTAAGVSMVCECAKEYNIPVIGMCGHYKLSPLYPTDMDKLVEVGDSSKVIKYEEAELMSKLQAINPLYDYVSPEYVDIYMTNLGGHTPAFTYRVVLDNYNSADSQFGLR